MAGLLIEIVKPEPDFFLPAAVDMISGSRKVRNSLILSQFAIGNNASGKKKSGLSFAISSVRACVRVYMRACVHLCVCAPDEVTS